MKKEFTHKKITKRALQAFFLVGMIASLYVPLYSARAALLTRPPNNLGLVGYWPLDDNSGTTARDASGNKNIGTLINSPTWTTGQLANAVQLNGSTQYISLTNLSASVTGSFSISLWMKYDGGQSGERQLFSAYTGTNEIGISLAPTTGVFRNFVDASGSSNNLRDSAIVPTPHTWYLVTLVFDNATKTKYRYINGVQDDAASTSVQITWPSVTAYLGNNTDQGGGRNFKGSIDDVRIYSRALSAADVATLYNLGATKLGATKLALSPTNIVPSGIVGYWPFDGKTLGSNVGDISGQGNSGFLSGFTSTSSAIALGRFGQALQFSGTNSVQTSYAGISGTAARSFTMWLKTTQQSPPTGKNTSTILSYGSGTCGNPSQFVIATNDKYGGSTDFQGITVDNPCVAAITYSAPNLYNGQWHFVAVVVPASANTGTLTVYVDGALQGTIVNGGIGAFNTGTGNNVMIGNDTLAGNGGFVGTIDDVRIYNRTLTAAEILQLYNAGATATVSANAVQATTASPSLVGYWPFNNLDNNWATGSTKDQSGHGNNGQFVNMSTTSSPVAGKVGQGLNFNGSGQYISIPLAFTSGQAVTIVAWVYSTETTATYRNVFDSQSQKPMIWWDTAGKVEFDAGLARSASVYRNTWTQVVLSKPAGSSAATYYVNGTSIGSGTAYTVPALTPTWFNRAGSQSWLGRADDLRIYNTALTAQQVLQLYNATK